MSGDRTLQLTYREEPFACISVGEDIRPAPSDAGDIRQREEYEAAMAREARGGRKCDVAEPGATLRYRIDLWERRNAHALDSEDGGQSVRETTEVDLRTLVADRLRSAVEADPRTVGEIAQAAWPDLPERSARRQLERITSAVSPRWPSPSVLAALAEALGLNAGDMLEVLHRGAPLSWE